MIANIVPVPSMLAEGAASTDPGCAVPHLLAPPDERRFAFILAILAVHIHSAHSRLCLFLCPSSVKFAFGFLYGFSVRLVLRFGLAENRRKAKSKTSRLPIVP